MSIENTEQIGISKPNRNLAFVNFIIERCKKDKGTAARLKRANNSATEYQSWEILAAFHINLDKDNERLPYATIAAAVAAAKLERNGNAGIGRAIASCYEDGNQSDQAKAKLRRLLACDSTKEACRILRPLFSLIDSKGKAALNYSGLLGDLLKFHWDESQTRIKSQWAQDFYGRRSDAKNEVTESTGGDA